MKLVYGTLLIFALTGCGGQRFESEKGAAGESGPTGQSGINGTSIITKTGEPTSDIGKNGDTYLDSLTDNLYTKVDDVWVLVGNIKGQTGEQGIAGVKGDKGDKGDSGLIGAKGDKGDKGDTGTKGDKGDSGSDGVKGDKGDRGDKGDKGDKGDEGQAGQRGQDGNRGDKGDSTYTIAESATDSQCPNNRGVVYTTFIDLNNNGSIDEDERVLTAAVICDGANGRDGVNGQDGRNGVDGMNGRDGAQGLKGDKGDQGLQGLQGAQGLKGDQGLQGLQGSQGIKGDQGLQGIQGLQGVKGDTGESGLQTVIKPCSNRSVKITRYVDGTLVTVTPNDGQTTLDWAVVGALAPSYIIGGSQTCTVYVDSNGKVCIVNPSRGTCASPL